MVAPTVVAAIFSIPSFPISIYHPLVEYHGALLSLQLSFYWQTLTGPILPYYLWSSPFFTFQGNFPSWCCCCAFESICCHSCFIQFAGIVDICSTFCYPGEWALSFLLHPPRSREFFRVVSLIEMISAEKAPIRSFFRGLEVVPNIAFFGVGSNQAEHRTDPVFSPVHTSTLRLELIFTWPSTSTYSLYPCSTSQGFSLWYDNE